MGSAQLMKARMDFRLILARSSSETSFAMKLYETERVSLGQAAKLAGYSKRAFIEILGRHKVPVFNYSPEDLREELGL